MRPILAIPLLLATTACGNAQPVATTTSGLAHHEVRADQLPPPYATPSAGNPPWVGPRPANAQLHVPAGYSVNVFASGLDDPRNMILAPNGDVIVAESGGDRISILRDANHDGVSDTRFTFTKEVNEPFGLAIRGDWLYVGNTDSIVRFPYRAGDTKASAAPQRLASLPGGGHSTRNILWNRDGTKLYVAIGSASNVSRETPPRASIMEYDASVQHPRVFASGLRNPVGLAWNPATGALWTSVNERDGLGDELVPDFVTDVRDGAFYGWPYAYIGAHEDPRRAGERRDLVAKTIVPSVLIQAHSSPLGITFWRGSLFVALHGSWNRSRRTGYKVIRVPFRDGRPAGGYDDFVTGWMPDERSSRVWGRPVGLLVLGDGSLLIADDGGNVIWRVTAR
jgi:glucose/arabinose dehydrogenase